MAGLRAFWTGMVAVLALAVLGSVALSQNKTTVPKFEVDPGWPKPLPEGWITGRLGSVCIDSHDHIIVTERNGFVSFAERGLL